MIVAKNIQWDTEGQSDLDLPDSILLIGFYEDSEEVSMIISETYGFNHHGYQIEKVEYYPPLELPAIFHKDIPYFL